MKWRYVMSNPRNESGKEFEKIVNSMLKESGMKYTWNKSSEGIDFIIHCDGYDYGIDAKGKGGGKKDTGSEDEKWPHTIWKYKDKYEKIAIVHRSLKSACKLKLNEHIASYGGKLIHQNEFPNFLSKLQNKKESGFFSG